MYNQSQFQESFNEYYNQNRKNNIKDFIGKIIVLIIALVHKFIGYPYLSKLLNETLKKNNIDDKLIQIILLVYLVLTFAFLFIAIWNVVKNIKIINVIYAIGVIVFVGYYGYNYYINSELYDLINNRPSASFVIEAKDICNKAKTYWQRETVTNSARQATYTKSNGVYCNNSKFVITDEKTNFSITLDVYGNIIDFKITNGKFKYTYSGDGLIVNDIVSDKFVKIEDPNEVIIPSC